MEIKRDNEKDKGISVVQYNPDLFHNDQQFYLAYRKLENVVSALFLVTGLIENELILRQSIRERGLACLSHFVSLMGKVDVGVMQLQTVATNILQLNSLIDIAFWSGQISHMNLTILQAEITSLYKTINDLSIKYKNNYYIDAGFFKADEQILSDINYKTDPLIHQRQNKRISIKDKL